MKKKTTGYVMAVCMLLTVSLYFVGGTYARYAGSFEGTASVSVAKWAVALKDNADSNEFTTTLKPATNANVVSGKIAPGVSATGTVEVNLAGTEVAVDILAEVDTDALETTLAGILGEGLSDHDISVAAVVSMPEGYTVTPADGKSTVALKDGAAFGPDAVATVTVTVTWNNDDEHNASHTAIGENVTADLEIPVTLTVEQHIGA